MADRSDDAQATLLLCSRLGLPPKSGPAPLTLREWNDLARRLHASKLGRPGALLTADDDDLRDDLQCADEEIERLRHLLDRGAALALECERLASRGIWAVTRADGDYPARLRERLKAAAPPVLFGCGELANVGRPGAAVVGSRDASDEARAAAEYFGESCARAGWAVYSGGARGIDGTAMNAALNAGGRVVGVLADSLERAARPPEAREALANGRLTLLTPYAPNAGFSVGAAMGRNRLIYALSDAAVVVASDAESGGTWAGAVEALRGNWVPVFVCDGPGLPAGNAQLIGRGGRSFPVPCADPPERVVERLSHTEPRPAQPTLF